MSGDREKVAQFMLARSIPTGHGDTIDDLLSELGGWVDRPIPMILFCPNCGTQHIDAGAWENPPHRTHFCQGCGHLWRPAGVFTEGVEDIPLGTSDTRPAIRQVTMTVPRWQVRG